MNISPDGLALIEHREGIRMMPYKDSAGRDTIGVGHLLTADELAPPHMIQLPSGPIAWQAGLSLAQVTELLRQDLERAEEAINRLVTVPLTQAQYDTLVSFVYNIGGGHFATSTLMHLLNQGQYGAVPTELRRWNFAGGKVDPILVRRRESECAQWAS